ncbi:hypothetical protein BDW_06005 [Bdellovibrio bacteriovorus W]|nr:hypothetical protein BDW_06005 [Bdellovibrio bacteriovorus W]
MEDGALGINPISATTWLIAESGYEFGKALFLSARNIKK